MLSNTKWITTTHLPDMLPESFNRSDRSVYFRCGFYTEKKPISAILNICILGLGVCTINGKSVTDDVLTTPYTCYDKRVIYQTYDVTNLIVSGENIIGIHAGNGFYNNNMTTWNDCMAPWRDKPKMSAKLSLEFADGRKEYIETDKQWKTHLGPCLYNHMRQGEIFDASEIQHGFDKAGFDDAEWTNAIYTHAPGGILSSEKTVPIKVQQIIKPISCNNGIYDFGVNISGWAKIRVTGAKGQKIVLSYAESLNDDGSINDTNNIFIKREGKTLLGRDEYICGGTDDEEYHATFCYHGFRFVEVENAPEQFEIEAHFIHSDIEQIGSFECSDEMLNKIHNASVRATLSNFVGIPTDCPHREQNGWTGDALWSCDQTLMNFDASEAYLKWFRDFKDVQRPNGQLPGIIPSAGWGYNWGSGPAWDSSLILMPYKIYLSTGKTEIIKELWQNMNKYMAYIESKANDYIVEFGLGDWCAPHPEDVCPTDVTDTAYFYADCVTMAKMAKLIGKESVVWEEKAAKIKDFWRKKFLDDKNLTKYQTFYACAIYQGLLNPDEVADAAKSLAQLVINNDYHFDCGTLGMKYIFDALSENGYCDVVYKAVTNPTFPSYAYWINNGMTTLCEEWDMHKSQNHHMYSEVDNWFYRYLGGIKITDDGLVISPVYLKDIDCVKATYKGISVERKGKHINVRIDVEAKIVIGDFDFKVSPGEYQFVI